MNISYEYIIYILLYVLLCKDTGVILIFRMNTPCYCVWTALPGSNMTFAMGGGNMTFAMGGGNMTFAMTGFIMTYAMFSPQETLIRLEYLQAASLRYDGDYLQEPIRKFQRFNGLEVTGESDIRYCIQSWPFPFSFASHLTQQNENFLLSLQYYQSLF